MHLAHSCIAAGLLLAFVEVIIVNGCYSSGTKFGDIVGGDITDPVKDFCSIHHGAPFKEGGQAKGCVETKKRGDSKSLNITIEFTSILDNSRIVNFTADACQDVLLLVAKKCNRGGEGITVTYQPVKASPKRQVRDESGSKPDQLEQIQNLQGRVVGVTPSTAEIPITAMISNNLIRPPGTPGPSLPFNSTAKYNDTTTTNETVPEANRITTTLPITLTITAPSQAASMITSTTTTTSITSSTTAKDTTTVTIEPPSTSCKQPWLTTMYGPRPPGFPCEPFDLPASSSATAMNLFFVAKVKMDPNDCGCAHCSASSYDPAAVPVAGPLV